MIVTELVLARHGEAVCNVDGVVGGPATCTGLTERGHRQATFLSRRLRTDHDDRPFTAFYATERQRVAQTAATVAEAIGLIPRTVVELRGPDPGAADGHPWTEVKTAFGGAPHQHPDLPYADGAESWNSYLDRAGKALCEIIERDRGGRILIVAHGETIEAAMALLLELPSDLSIRARFATDHASITRWQLQQNRLGQLVWYLLAHNDVSHLESA